MQIEAQQSKLYQYLLYDTKVSFYITYCRQQQLAFDGMWFFFIGRNRAALPAVTEEQAVSMPLLPCILWKLKLPLH